MTPIATTSSQRCSYCTPDATTNLLKELGISTVAEVREYQQIAWQLGLKGTPFGQSLEKIARQLEIIASNPPTEK